MISLVFSQEQIDFICENQKGIYNKDLTEMLNKEFGTDFTLNQVKGFKARNNIDSGIRPRFKKGSTPFNKGMRQEDYMTSEAIEKTKASRFKKGQVAHNKKPIGYERITEDGYTEIKVSDDDVEHSVDNFDMKHRKVWMDYYKEELGPGDIVIFLDQSRDNFDIENLMKIERGDMSLLNLQRALTDNPEINKSSIHLIRLMRRISKLEAQGEHR